MNAPVRLAATSLPVLAALLLGSGLLGNTSAEASLRTTSLTACTIVGTDGADTLRGTVGDDVICGGDGSDVISGGAGFDVVVGGAGDDRLDGGAGRDLILGGPGKDRIDGDTGHDFLFGGLGTDTVVDYADSRVMSLPDLIELLDSRLDGGDESLANALAALHSGDMHALVRAIDGAEFCSPVDRVIRSLPSC